MSLPADTTRESPVNDSDFSETTKSTLLIYGIKGYSFPKVGFRQRPGKFYVQITIDQRVRSTSVATGNGDPVWDDMVYMDAYTSSIIIFKVFARRTLSPDWFVGEIRECISSLVAQAAEGGVGRVLTSHEPNISEKSCIQFKLKLIDDPSIGVRNEIEQAGNETRGMKLEPSLHEEAAMEQLASVVEGFKSAVDPWKSLLTRVELLSQIVDKIAEIHPYAKMAWSILSLAHKVLIGQKERDQRVAGLVETMNDTLSFVDEAEPLKKIESQKMIIGRLTQQLVECAYFVRDYATKKSFWMRTLKYTISDVDRHLEELVKKLEEFKACLQGYAVINTQIMVIRMLDNLSDVETSLNLNEMQYAKGVGYDPEKGCLPGTRQEVINEIIEWVNLPDSDNVQRICWLSGVAGSGKSAIAHSLAGQFDESQRLGSSFCFDATRVALRRPHHLFPTISLDISHLDKHWKSSLSNIVKDNHALLTTESVQLQFKSFLLEPSMHLATIGPVVIVIDALDESGDAVSRKGILSALSKRSQELPANFRILITSRPEVDIEDAFGNNLHIRCMRMDSISGESNKNDISAFIYSQLSNISSFEESWLNEAQCDMLVKKSEGLFQWAATACLFIQGNGQTGSDPSEQINIILSEPSHHQDVLDSLYHTVLERVCPTGVIPQERFRLVLGRVIAAREPLSLSVLSELRNPGENINTVEFTLQSLGSLFSGVTGQFSPVLPLHSSIRDFLTDPERSGRFYIDFSLHHQHLAHTCFRVMESGLRFNICGLDTSYRRNCDVSNLNSRIMKNIPPYLQYACRFWAAHLQATRFEINMLCSLQSFLYNQVLYWLEVVSVTKMINIVPQAMLYTEKWCEGKDRGVAVFAKDLARFVAAFSDPISQSSPHIYLSALPLAPKESLVSIKFLPHYANALALLTDKLSNWPTLENTMEGHQRAVRSVAFSPDGIWVVSSSDDGTIRMWDVGTGATIGPVLKGHINEVHSVAISPDGSHIGSGSRDKTIRLWDTATGECIGRPLEGHTSCVSSVAFSPCGQRLGSGSWDGTVRVWDTITGKTIGSPLREHTSDVNSVAFSPDGKLIASGSDDKTIRLWDVQSGTCVGSPFKGHLLPIFSVSFSPNGNYIASGSSDMTIRIWDVETHSVIGSPMEGHCSDVCSIAFSPDGKHLVSGSWDYMFILWDTETRVGSLLEGHTGAIYSVAFSPSGKHIISGSSDGMVRLWNVQKGKPKRPIRAPNSVTLPQDVINTSSGPDTKAAGLVLGGHTNIVISIAFSPDGECIASCSQYTPIMLWNAKTGESMGPKLSGQAGFFCIAVSPDGKYIAAGSQDAKIQLWDMKTGDVVHIFGIFHTGAVYSIAFSPDGRYIASGSADQTIVLWKIVTGEKASFSPLKGHSGGVNSVAFSPDGKYLASGSTDQTIRLWNAFTGAVIGLPLQEDGRVSSLAFSPDGERIVSGSYSGIKLWNIRTHAATSSSFEGHTRGISAVSFSPDGELVASGSFDTTIRVWDSETGIGRSLFTWHSGIVTSVAFSPDGRRIASAADDKAIRIWNLELSDIDTKTCPDHSSLDLVPGAPKRPCLDSNLHTEHGWIMDSSSNLILWVPPWYRAGLNLPENTLVIHDNIIKLDLRKFLHGFSWTKCRS